MGNRIPTLVIAGPGPDAVVGTAPFPITGVVTSPGNPEPMPVSVTVRVGGQKVPVKLHVTGANTPVMQTAFSATGQIGGGSATILVVVNYGGTIPVTGSVVVQAGPLLVAPSLWADLTLPPPPVVEPSDVSKIATDLQQNLLPTIAQKMVNMSVVQDVFAMGWNVVGPNLVAVPSANMLRIGFWLVDSDFPAADIIEATTDFPLWQMTPDVAAGCFALVPQQPSPLQIVRPASEPLFGFALSVPTATVQLIVDALFPSIRAAAARHNFTVDSITVQTGAANALVGQVSGSFLDTEQSATVTETLGIAPRPGTQSNSEMPAVADSSVSNVLADIAGLAGTVKSKINGALQEFPAWIPFHSSSLSADPSLQNKFPFPMAVLNFESFGTNDSGVIGTGSGSLANRDPGMVGVNLTGPTQISDYQGNEDTYKVLLTAFEPDNDQMTWQFSDLDGAGTNTVNTDAFSQDGSFSTAFPIPSSVRQYSFTLSVNGTETSATNPPQTLEGSASLPVTVVQDIQSVSSQPS